MAVEFREPWYEVDDEFHRTALQRQYDLDISEEHPVGGEKGRVLGKHVGTDDVLIQSVDGRFAIVHLTWSTGPGDARWPEATVYAAASDVSRVVAKDAEEHQAINP